jgi:hypothetical protein
MKIEPKPDKNFSPGVGNSAENAANSIKTLFFG